jgi:hypothetical protein
MSLSSHRLQSVIISSAIGGGIASKANVLRASPCRQTNGNKSAVGYIQDFADKANLVQQQQTMDHAVDADSSLIHQTNVDKSNKIRKTTETSRNVPSFLNRPMRPQSAMKIKYYMKYLTDFEHHEIFDYPEVSVCHSRKLRSLSHAEDLQVNNNNC